MNINNQLEAAACQTEDEVNKFRDAFKKQGQRHLRLDLTIAKAQ